MAGKPERRAFNDQKWFDHGLFKQALKLSALRLHFDVYSVSIGKVNPNNLPTHTQ